jgi:hypothetical protein
MTAQQSTTNKSDAAVAAIEYAIGQGIDAATFLTCWMHGDFDVIRREWPDAPEDVFRGAEPMLPAVQPMSPA